MAIVSGGLPRHEITQLITLRWRCRGGGRSAYGDTSEQAYNEWVELIRYDYWRN